MENKPGKYVLKGLFNIILTIFLIIGCYSWTSIPRTNKYVAIAIYVFVGIMIILSWLTLFRNCRYLCNILVAVAGCVLIITNLSLSVWYRSIQSVEGQVLYYSAFFQPNGDLSMLQLLLENKTLITSTDEIYYKELLNKLGDEIIYKEIEKESILGLYEFEDMGELRSLYGVYSSLFDLKYDNPKQFPKLFVSPFDVTQDANVVVLSDDLNNLYIFQENK